MFHLEDGSYELVEKLYFDQLVDFVYVELMRGLQRGFVPKRCANCGRWFLQTPGASYNYCNQPAPNSEEGKICREVGSSKNFREKVLNNEIWAIHQRAYKKYFARTKKGTMTKSDFLAWETESERLREEALSEYGRSGSGDFFGTGGVPRYLSPGGPDDYCLFEPGFGTLCNTLRGYFQKDWPPVDVCCWIVSPSSRLIINFY